MSHFQKEILVAVCSLAAAALSACIAVTMVLVSLGSVVVWLGSGFASRGIETLPDTPIVLDVPLDVVVPQGRGTHTLSVYADYADEPCTATASLTSRVIITSGGEVVVRSSRTIDAASPEDHLYAPVDHPDLRRIAWTESFETAAEGETRARIQVGTTSACIPRSVTASGSRYESPSASLPVGLSGLTMMIGGFSFVALVTAVIFFVRAW